MKKTELIVREDNTIYAELDYIDCLKQDRQNAFALLKQHAIKKVKQYKQEIDHLCTFIKP